MDPGRDACVFCRPAGTLAPAPQTDPSLKPAAWKQIAATLVGLALAAMVYGVAVWLDDARLRTPPSSPTPDQACSAARDEIRQAKDRRDREQRAVAIARDPGQDSSGLETTLAAYRRQVDEAARKARAIPGCNIDDLVGPGVGR